MIFDRDTEWEFRLSDDRRTIAFFDPGNSPWFIPEANMRGRFASNIDLVKDVNGRTVDWIRFIPAARAARKVLKIVAEWAAEEPEAAAKLVRQLERKGFTLPEEDE